MKAEKLTAPRWQTAETCKHDFQALSKNGPPNRDNSVPMRCRKCGYRKTGRG